MPDSDFTPADDDSQAGSAFGRGFRTGAVCTVFSGLALFCAVEMLINLVPHRQPHVYRAGNEPLTVEGIVAECHPYVTRAVQSEVPFGFRLAARVVGEHYERKLLTVGIARYGHQVSPVLGAVQPMADTLFRSDVADRCRQVKGLLDTPVGDLGPVEVQARAEAGPAVEVGR